MRFLYDLFFIIFSILYIPYLVIKGKGTRKFSQKFGFLPEEITRMEGPVWIHAVSVGEAVLAAKLSKAIKRQFPDVPIVVSTTTPTGNEMILKSGRNFVNGVFYYPLDIRAIVSRVVRLIKPRVYVMIETELWPNLMEELSARNIPAIVVNGRISDNSFRNYMKIRGIMKRILNCISCFCMQSGKDAERVIQLGASADRVFVSGNIKFDEAALSPALKGFNREYLGFCENNNIVVAGSTHFPEEEAIINVYKELKEKNGNLKLILVPRHIERAEAIKIYVEKAGLNCCRFSDILAANYVPPGSNDVLLVDTIGHLKDIYSVADVVFIGGSLARKGGQNPIEPARWGKTVIFGPHMFNFRKVADMFLDNNAAVCIDNAEQLKSVIAELLKDSRRNKQISENALRVIKENSGAVDRTVEKIKEYMNKDGEV